MPKSDNESVLSTHRKSDGELSDSSDNLHKRSRRRSQKQDRTRSYRQRDMSPSPTRTFIDHRRSRSRDRSRDRSREISPTDPRPNTSTKTATVRSQVVVRQDHNHDDDDSWHETVDADDWEKFKAWNRSKERQNKRKHAISSSSSDYDEDDTLQVEEENTKDRPTQATANEPDDSDFDVDTELAKRLNKKKSISIRDKVAAEYNQEEEYGPPIVEDTARLVQKMMKAMPEATYKEKCKKYKVPDNLQYMCTPGVNKELWGDLDGEIKNSDIRMQSSQKALIKCTAALSLLMDKCMAINDRSNKLPTLEEFDDITTTVSDSLGLGLNANRQMNYARRSNITSYLVAPYSKLSSKDVAITKELFGDNFMKTVENLEKAQEVGKSCTNKDRKKRSKHSQNQRFATKPRQKVVPWYIQQGHSYSKRPRYDNYQSPYPKNGRYQTPRRDDHYNQPQKKRGGKSQFTYKSPLVPP